MVWTLPAQASWEEYQQAGEAAYDRGDYATARRMFLAAVREARHFGPEDPRLDISLNKLTLLRVAHSADSQADVRTQRVTKNLTPAPAVHRGHQRQTVRPGPGMPGQDVNTTPCSQHVLESAAKGHGPL